MPANDAPAEVEAREARDVIAFGQEIGRVLSDGRIVADRPWTLAHFCRGAVHAGRFILLGGTEGGQFAAVANTCVPYRCRASNSRVRSSQRKHPSLSRASGRLRPLVHRPPCTALSVCGVDAHSPRPLRALCRNWTLAICCGGALATPPPDGEGWS